MGGAASKTEEDGVSSLHGDEGAESIIDCAVDKAREKAADQKEQVGMDSGDFGVEIGVCALQNGTSV